MNNDIGEMKKSELRFSSLLYFLWWSVCGVVGCL